MLLTSLVRQETSAALSAQIIEDEVRWRQLPTATADGGAGRIRLARWSAQGHGTREAQATSADDCYTVGIALRQMDLSLFRAGRPLHSGRVLPGALQITAPGQTLRAQFRGPYDALHLFVTPQLLAGCYEMTDGRGSADEILLVDPALDQDAVVERLARALLLADQMGGAVGSLYADAVGLAIVTRLLAAHSNRAPATRRGRTALPAWRLKRAVDYIDAHLAESVGLADLAASVGLTRMHFAAQFRAATGARPHEFVLRRRIERAQDLLAQSDLPLVEVAFSVGFQTQAHFSTVFKRFAGTTPLQWRRLNRIAA